MCEQWTRRKVLNLIQCFRNKECLWKFSNIEYTDRKARSDAWDEIAKTVGCDVRSAERKIKSLRTQFFRYYKEASKPSGSGTVGDVKRRWFAYDLLRFLIQDRVPRGCEKMVRSTTFTAYNIKPLKPISNYIYHLL